MCINFYIPALSSPCLPPEMSGVGIGGLMLEASAKFMGNVDDRGGGLQGVDITVWSNCGDFSAMGYVVDQLDSLIDEWFPGTLSVDRGSISSVYKTCSFSTCMHVH